MKGIMPQKSLDHEQVTISDPFWNHWISTNRQVTLPYQFGQLMNSGRVDNFLRVARGRQGGFIGMIFNDSDIYKWIEAASWELRRSYNRDLETRINTLVQTVLDAQAEDGYINTYIMLQEPDKRWSNLGMMHELYCAGHLIEAAVAHHIATGETRLLEGARRFADLIHRVFLREGRSGTSGHEEIELALVILYRHTGDEGYLALAQLFLERRGTLESGFRQEAEDITNIAGYRLTFPVDNFEPKAMDEFYRDFYFNEEGAYDGRYAQDHLPVRIQRTPEGHAVRAMYLYCAAADIAAETGDRELLGILGHIWQEMVMKRMYVTGGIGSAVDMEGFTSDYDLPNDLAYAETCAAVGSVMWNHRMLRYTGDGCYADLLEQVLYNGFLSGVSYHGREFFYVNPLQADSSHRRKGWFSVACCPTNATRLLSSLERYIYTMDDRDIYVHLYISSTLDMGDGVTITQQGTYPWSGEITLSVTFPGPTRRAVKLRLPGWCPRMQIILPDGSEKHITREDTVKGYISIEREWNGTEKLILRMDMPVKQIIAHPGVIQNRGKRALVRGPLVYCVEDADNPMDLDRAVFLDTQDIQERFDQELFGGTMVLEVPVFIPDNTAWDHTLYRDQGEGKARLAILRAIPYHLWANRDPGEMRVWLPCSCCNGTTFSPSGEDSIHKKENKQGGLL